MGYRMSRMTILRGTEPEKFVAKVRRAFTKHKGNLVHAAHDLDVGESTLKRWVKEDDDLGKFLRQLREQHAA